MPAQRTTEELTLQFGELSAADRAQQVLPLRAAVTSAQLAAHRLQSQDDSVDQTSQDLQGLTKGLPSQLKKWGRPSHPGSTAPTSTSRGAAPTLRFREERARKTRPGTAERTSTLKGAKPVQSATKGQRAAQAGPLGGSLRATSIVGAGQRARAAEALATRSTATAAKDAGLAAGRSITARATTAAVNAVTRFVAAALAALTGVSASTVVLVAAIVVAVIAAIAVFLPMINQAATEEQGSIGGTLTAQSGVPANLIPLYNQAGTLCPEMPAVLLAAQGKQESGFNPNATSPVGAQGIAQFMPGTWATWGQDANGDGVASVFDPADAIQSQAAFMCALVTQMRDLVEAGRATGDVQVLALSAYNAGPGAVARYGGVPPYAETQAYAPKILAIAAGYGATLTSVGTGDYAAVIDALQARLGTPYSWGGGTVNGPSRGFAQGANTIGWDCSSFVQYGFYQGTGGKLTLPRTARAQAVALQQYQVNGPLQPGDLLFYGGIASANHVAMYVGDGKMIEEPRTGLSARITTARTSYSLAVRVPLP
ncbi:NlpC/P60 family protein [Kineococcus sp. SYSU DK003]|uniref:NlpC/P60 family protein n=1 Tax=Kineococcus sp. SYSU DK003 TaxID=3383124 RepID=UPI003D7EC357